MDTGTTVHITGLMHQLVNKAKNTVRELDSSNELTFLRLRSKKHEIMCAPGEYFALFTDFVKIKISCLKGPEKPYAGSVVISFVIVYACLSVLTSYRPSVCWYPIIHMID
jgi:hypothetical protein